MVLDGAVCAKLGTDSELVDSIRRSLAAEPSVVGRDVGMCEGSGLDAGMASVRAKLAELESIWLHVPY